MVFLEVTTLSLQFGSVSLWLVLRASKNLALSPCLISGYGLVDVELASVFSFVSSGLLPA